MTAMNKAHTRKPLLLVRPKPKSGEEMTEYVQRLAYVNGLKGVSDLASLLNVALSQLLDCEPAVLRAIILGRVSPDVLSHRNRPRGSWRPYVDRLRTWAHARVCVACLKESDRLRATWSLPLSVSCTRHQTQLLDHCPECSLKIDRKRSQYRCRCGFEYRELGSVPGPDWERAFYRLFAPWRTDRLFAKNSERTIEAEISAARIVRKILNEQEAEIAPSQGVDNSRANLWWIDSADHPAIARICSNPRTLGRVIDGAVRAKGRWSYEAWERQARAISGSAPGALRVFRKARQIQERCAQKGPSSVPDATPRATQRSVAAIASALKVSHRSAATLVRDPHWCQRLRLFCGAPASMGLLECVRAALNSSRSIPEIAKATGIPAAWLKSGWQVSEKSLLRILPRDSRSWRLPIALVDELTRRIDECMQRAGKEWDSSNPLLPLKAIPERAHILQSRILDQLWSGDLALFGGGFSHAQPTLMGYSLPSATLRKMLPLRSINSLLRNQIAFPQGNA